MPEINVNLAGVKKLLKKLNPNKASGPDGISSRFLKEMGDELAPACGPYAHCMIMGQSL